MSPVRQLDTESQLRHLQATDEARFMELLFKTYYAPVCRAAARVLGQPGPAEDVAQEVFANVWQGRAALRVTGAYGGYLHRAAVNTALHHLQKARRQVLLDDDALAGLGPLGNCPAEELAGRELAAQLAEAIAGLPPACRNIFVMSRYEALSYADIATALDLSVKTVENQLGKALRRLRQRLQLPGHLLLSWFL